MLINKFILVLISLSSQLIIKAEVPRNTINNDESRINKRVEDLEREIGKLKTENRYLRFKLERVELKAEQLEQEIKHWNSSTKTETFLEKYIKLTETADSSNENDLKASLLNCLLQKVGTKQVEASSTSTQQILTPQPEPKNYDEHFNCIENCEDTKRLPKTCSEALAINRTGDGIYEIYATNSSLKPFYVYCLQDAYGDNAWLVIQRRQVGTTNFARNWTEYVQGFGELDGDYWLGLERIHALTTARKHELWIQMQDHGGVGRYASYSEFKIGNETENFKLLSLNNYTGDAGDSLGFNYEAQFSTYDRDNDSDEESNCAEKRMSGWWFRDCKHSSLNGLYNSTDYGTGINWIGWHDYRYSLKYVHLAIRPESIDLLKRTATIIKPVWETP